MAKNVIKRLQDKDVERKVESYKGMSEDERVQFGHAIVDKRLKTDSKIRDLDKKIKALEGDKSVTASVQRYVMGKQASVLRKSNAHRRRTINACADVKVAEMQAKKKGIDREM